MFMAIGSPDIEIGFYLSSSDRHATAFLIVFLVSQFISSLLKKSNNLVLSNNGNSFFVSHKLSPLSIEEWKTKF